MISWCVLQTFTGKERGVAGFINGYGLAWAYVPVRKLFERHRGKWQYVTKTMFPGYVFVEAEMNPAKYYAMLAAPNAIRFLGKGAEQLPEAIPEEQMRFILLLECGVVDECLIVSKDKRRRRATIRLDVLDETKYMDVAYGPTSSPE